MTTADTPEPQNYKRSYGKFTLKSVDDVTGSVHVQRECNGRDNHGHQWLEDKVQQQLPLLPAKTISCAFSLLLSELNLPKSPPQ